MPALPDIFLTIGLALLFVYMMSDWTWKRYIERRIDGTNKKVDALSTKFQSHVESVGSQLAFLKGRANDDR